MTPQRSVNSPLVSRFGSGTRRVQPWLRTGLAVGSLVGAALLAAAAPAQASPLDPGPFDFGDDVPFCSAPIVAPGQPGWSQVTCGVGAHQLLVPPAVHVLRVDVRGARGGSGGGGAPGGAGEEIKASIMVSPGERLAMVVGGVGDSHADGGVNGGGNVARLGVTGRTTGGGGGGSSDIRVDVNGGLFGPWNRIISAGGGGGGGGAGLTAGSVGGNGGRNALPGQAAPGAAGGAGGLPATYRGNGAGGGSGTRAGGAGGADGAGDLIGGTGGLGATAPGGARAGDGGGGGGGYGFGGGGAGGAIVIGAGTATGRTARAAGGGGGGGGSSYVDPAFLKPGSTVTHLPGAATGDGSIVVTFQAPPIQCGQTIYRSMTLTTDLDCRGSRGLILGGQLDELADSGLVFDLGGHTIRGSASQIGLDQHTAGAVVRNGTLRGFGTAISEHGLSGRHIGGPSLVVQNLRLIGGVTGVLAVGDAGGIYLSVDHTTISGMGDVGLEAAADQSGFVQVTNTTVTHSGAGIDTETITTVLDHDVLTGNVGPGVNINADSATVTADTIVGNGTGLRVAAVLSGIPGITPDDATMTIVGNTVRANAGSGISLSGGATQGSVLTGNHLAGNGFDPDPGQPGDPTNGDPGTPADPGDGVVVSLDDAADLLVGGNAARGNAGWGIDAIGVTDGGGNLASGNHPGEDCRGVVCTAH